MFGTYSQTALSAVAFWVQEKLLCLNIDQRLKCIMVTHKVRSWTWVKRLV